MYINVTKNAQRVLLTHYIDRRPTDFQFAYNSWPQRIRNAPVINRGLMTVEELCALRIVLDRTESLANSVSLGHLARRTDRDSKRRSADWVFGLAGIFRRRRHLDPASTAKPSCELFFAVTDKSFTNARNIYEGPAAIMHQRSAASAEKEGTAMNCDDS